MSWKIRHCRGCGREIIWTETEKGRRMPVDAEPTEDGTFVLLNASTYYGLPADDSMIPIAVHVGSKSVPTMLTDAELKAERRYTAHHATCPEVDSFR